MCIMSFTTHKDPINNLILQRENTNLDSDLHKVTEQLSVPLRFVRTLIWLTLGL